MADTDQLAPGQQAIYDSVYEALADYTSEADARAQAMEAATQPVPYRGSSEELAFHRGGPATFFGTRMNLAPGNIVDFPPAMLPPAPPEQPAELLSTNDVPGARFVQPPAASPVVPPTDAAFPRSAEPPPVPLPLGTERRFAPQPPAQFNPLEDIRKQINATQFKTAQEALAAATRFQYLRAFQRDVDSGVPAEKALLRWGPGLFEKSPTAISGMMRAAQPAFTPRPLPGQSNIFQVGPRGQNLWSPPASAFPKPPLSTNVTEYTIPGTTNVFARSIESGPQTRRFFEANAGNLSPSANITRLNSLIRAAENEIKTMPTALAGVPMDESIKDKVAREADRKKRFDNLQAERKALKDEVNGMRQQLKDMGPTGAAPAVAAPAAAAPAAKPEAAAKPESRAEAILKEANEALRLRPDKRAEILKRLKEMGIEVK